MRMNYVMGALAAFAAVSSAQAAGFVNGGFDNGTTSGWTIGGGSRSGQNLSVMNPASYLNGTDARSAVVTPGLDPTLGALMPNRVYSGTNSYRLQDGPTVGGFVSVISQTVLNYTDPDIFFTWLASLEGAHSAEQAAGMIIQLQDLTMGDTPISRVYSAAPGAVDARFTLSSGGYYYTNAWRSNSSRSAPPARATTSA